MAHRLLADDPLELFALWRKNRHSFYLGDEARPTLVHSSNHAEALRQEIADVLDRHGVPGPAGRGLVEVIRRFNDLPVPLYSPLSSDIFGIVVHTDPLRCWVLGGAGDRTLGQLIDAIAFWMWQLAGDLDCEELEVHVSLGEKMEATRTEPGRIEVTLDPERVPALQSPDNTGERQLVRALLEAINGSAPDEVIERVAPLGVKKMILVFDATADAALDSRDLPPARPPLRESDDGKAMDELGEHLRTNLGLDVGPIASDRRVETLWAAIEFHLDQLMQLIASLSPNGVLEAFIALNERLLNEGAFTRYTVPTRLACFGDSTDIEANLRDDLERHAAASTAVRFVIESVAAQPPRGIRPMTLAVQDRLVALAFQIAARGGISDAIREGLDDTSLSILPSGRLGVSREGRFYSGRERFADRFVVGEIRRSHRHFSSLWARKTEFDEQAAADVAVLDEAALHEWGATISEILELFAALVHISERAPVTVLPLAEAVGTLATLLGWETQKVSTLIDHFALRPRAELLEPDPPFAASDVYPWRYGRRLSAVRRPLVRRPGCDGDELVYGFRAVDSAGRQLVHEIETARLKVESPEMQRAITALRQRDDLLFNGVIADLYREVPGLIVRERVEKVGKLVIARRNGDRLGDVDVLIADPGRRVLEAVDTKNLAAGRTPIEIAREMKRTFKTEGSKHAAMDIHVERGSWLQAHLDDVLTWLGLDLVDSDAWRVEPSIVVDAEVPASFLDALPMRVLDAAALREELAERIVSARRRP